MPGLTGIQLIESLNAEEYNFVFVTAYSEHCLKAIELITIYRTYLSKLVGAGGPGSFGKLLSENLDILSASALIVFPSLPKRK